jgi:hypothetical protein
MAIDPKKTMVKVKKSMLTDKEIENASENKIEKTRDFTEAKEKMQKNANSASGKQMTENMAGININSQSMKADAKEFNRDVIKFGGENGSTRIMSSDGNSVKYEGRSNMQATKDALALNQSQTKDTNARRDYNANNYNVQSGAKKDLDNKDKKVLVKLSKAVKK